MKKISIILSIIFILCFGCFSGCGMITYRNYENSDNYQIGNFTFNKDEIEKANIYWESGTINLSTNDSENFNVAESGKNLKDEQKLHYIIENKVLTIHFCGSGYVGSIFSDSKILSLNLPKDIDINVEIGSGKINANSIFANDINFSSGSGEIEIENLQANMLNVDFASGSVEINKIECKSDVIIEGSSGDIEIESVVANKCHLETSSGEIEVDNVKVTSKVTASAISGNIEIESIETTNVDIRTESGSPKLSIKRCENGLISAKSGNIQITLLNNFGAKIKSTQKSGSFKTNLNYQTVDDYKVFNNGNSILDLSTTSGNIVVK